MKPLSIVFILIASLTSCHRTVDGKAEMEDRHRSIERGEYLVAVIGCDHCHTPKKMTDQGPVPDRDRWLMGHPADRTLPQVDQVGPDNWLLFDPDLTAVVGPWGISYAANLTPHPSGLGNWTYAQFKRAMTEGRHKGLENGRMLLPPMPWQSYQLMTDEDLQAIFDYLQSIPPIDNTVPSPVPPGEN